jgi:hypothetical protein
LTIQPAVDDGLPINGVAEGLADLCALQDWVLDVEEKVNEVWTGEGEGPEPALRLFA